MIYLVDLVEVPPVLVQEKVLHNELLAVHDLVCWDLGHHNVNPLRPLWYQDFSYFFS